MSKIEGTVIAASRLEGGAQATGGIVVWTTAEHKAEIERWEYEGLVVVERKADHDAREAEVKWLREELGKARQCAAACIPTLRGSATVDELAQHLARRLEVEAMKYKVLKWLLNGHVGLSSKAMAAHLCGFPCDGDYPRDPDDFRRCIILLDSVPEARALLPKMAEVNRYWAALVSRWDEIEAAFRDECRGPVVFCSAPKTYRLMNEIINKADKAGEEPAK